jgi:fatty-acyl-CoA synthase
LTRVEIGRICVDADVSLIFTERCHRHLLDTAPPDVLESAVISIDDDVDQEWITMHGTDTLEGDGVAFGDDPAILCYTSGTTGAPKGAILSHQNLDAMAAGAIAFEGLNTKDRAIVPVPLAFVGAGVAMALPLLRAGGSVLIRQEFEASQMLRDISQYSVTTVGVVPVILDRMSRDPDFATTNLSSWRAAKCGGSVPPTGLLELYQSRGVRLASAYGLTEAGAFNILLPPDDAIRKRGSIGMPVMGQEAKVVDTDGVEVDRGTRGELVLRGEAVFLGYWHNDAATNEALRNGWLHTGDIAVQDDEGYFWIVDRAKDVIISGGNNIYSAEVEAALMEHPAVSDVAVVGMPDAKWGETPVAWVVTEDAELSLEDLLDFMKDRLAKYKRPTKLIVIDALPRGATGKILKRELRTQFIDEDTSVRAE